MDAPFFHLAQLNIARVKAPLDHPSMEGFVSRLPTVNALAEASPGFVWRLQTEAGDATSLRPYDDPALIVNMSVWESPEALRAFVYRSGHSEPLRMRQQWFEPMPKPFQAMWWIPAGHLPTVAEGKARLAFLAAHGDSDVAFGFTRIAPAPPSPDTVPSVASTLSLEGRRFVLEANEAGADCQPGMTFHYRQHGVRVRALYGGGDVLFGALVAHLVDEDRLDARYQHATRAGEVRTGRCETRVERLPDHRIRLHEQWQWLSGAEGTGRSTLIEATSDAVDAQLDERPGEAHLVGGDEAKLLVQRSTGL
jgi:hypothetical protein